MTKVYNDLLLATDIDQVSALCLLDPTAAFDPLPRYNHLNIAKSRYLGFD